jgi:hypothetical protein
MPPKSDSEAGFATVFALDRGCSLALRPRRLRISQHWPPQPADRAKPHTKWR